MINKQANCNSCSREREPHRCLPSVPFLPSVLSTLADADSVFSSLIVAFLFWLFAFTWTSNQMFSQSAHSDDTGQVSMRDRGGFVLLPKTIKLSIISWVLTTTITTVTTTDVQLLAHLILLIETQNPPELHIKEDQNKHEYELCERDGTQSKCG